MIEEKLNKYFSLLNGDHPATGLYHQILKEVEKPLIKTVLKNVNGNKLKTAKILGINRNTLAKKIILYKL